jgi:hypothetical protein
MPPDKHRLLLVIVVTGISAAIERLLLGQRLANKTSQFGQVGTSQQTASLHTAIVISTDRLLRQALKR